MSQNIKIYYNIMSIKCYYEYLVKISRVIYAFSNNKIVFNLNSKTIKILSKTSLAPKCPFFHNFYYLIFSWEIFTLGVIT